ncbi:hypothetical protein [Gracilimonas mengyeensis]|uniref:Carboxypeptidase regulatory-like domain-containing protein n=1 Tax=Gracilimonas mengyeensis TaxID=1302730 RepID=A0A521ESP7_9BACT|nr:hypothetical protein [Gracilimonas mengyeensis]SMO86978.1 hypothetical protein SAMN06265219_113115 [Gracilimonas mengyeensis]
MKHFVFTILVVSLSFSFSSCKTSTEPNEREKGHVSVLVIDQNEIPVKDIEIYLAPESILKVTDTNGRAFFTVDVGDYFIDADICCMGPGFIKYHVPVTVEKSDTVKQILHACSACL